MFVRLLRGDGGLEWRGFGGIADVELKFTGVHLPCFGGFVPVGERAGVEGESDVLGFAGGEADFFEAFKLAFGAGYFRIGFGDVELGNFGSGDATGVGDVEGDLGFSVDGNGRGSFEVGEGEGGVAKAVPKG